MAGNMAFADCAVLPKALVRTRKLLFSVCILLQAGVVTAHHSANLPQGECCVAMPHCGCATGDSNAALASHARAMPIVHDGENWVVFQWYRSTSYGTIGKLPMLKSVYVL